MTAAMKKKEAEAVAAAIAQAQSTGTASYHWLLAHGHKMPKNETTETAMKASTSWNNF
jgi:hypothetical protein